MNSAQMIQTGAVVQITPKLFLNFWKKVDTSGDCWIWTGGVGKSGYGVFGVKRRSVSAHRFSYETIVSKITDRLLLRHTCDNKRCVRPGHLIPGNHRENAADAKLRNPEYGRHEKRSKIDRASADLIRVRFSEGESRATLSAEFGITVVQVWRITTGKAWPIQTSTLDRTNRSKTIQQFGRIL